MKRIAIFVDANDLYFTVTKNRFKGHKVSYKKILEYLSDLGDITTKRVYVRKKDHGADKFLKALERLGFEVRIKDMSEPETVKTDHWSSRITVEAMTVEEELVVLCSSFSSLIPLIETLRAKGKDVGILACGITSEMRRAASWFVEIPESMLESKQPKMETLNAQADAGA